MSWKKVKLKQILKQYRIEHLVQDNIEYKQVTISKHDGVTFRGTKMGKEIGRKRQFQIDLKKYPNTLMFVRQGVQDGSIGMAPLEVDGCIATENMPMFSVEGINLEYLKILLKSPYFYDQLNKIQTTGSAQKSIHEREILEIEIPFPDIDEQEDIVKDLYSKKDNSTAISTELTHQLSLVKKLRQQLLQDAVQGKLVKQNPKDEPAGELLEKIKAEKAKLIAEKKLKKEKELPPIKPEEIPFEIPENWVWCRLGEICEESFYGPRFGKGDYVTNGIPTIRTTDMTDDGEIVLKDTPCIKITDDKKIDLYKVRNGDLLLTRSGSIGIMAIFRGDYLAIPSAYLIRFRFLSDILPEYVFSLLKSPEWQKLLGLNSRATAQVNINATNILKLPFPLPPFAEQNRIVQKLDELMQYCNDLEESINQSESQNEKLLQQVLREALRPVSMDAEKEAVAV